MASQAKLPLSPPASRTAEVGIASAQQDKPFAEAVQGEPAPIWLQRLSLGVLVVFCLYLGALLAYLPWSKDLWDHNSLLLGLPRLHRLLMTGPMRGLVSGLGLLDLWIGISEIVHYREYRR